MGSRLLPTALLQLLDSPDISKDENPMDGSWGLSYEGKESKTKRKKNNWKEKTTLGTLTDIDKNRNNKKVPAVKNSSSRG